VARTITLTLTVEQAAAIRLAASHAFCDGEDARVGPAGWRGMAKLEDAIETATGQEFASRLTGRKKQDRGPTD
jgi:hypothetical protein